MAESKVAHILVVEDDGDLREVLQYMLEDERYKVSTAGTGSEALSLAADENVDLVLLDISMADMSGIEVARSLRADPKTADIRIVMHSGLQEAAVREQFSGYDCFVQKCDDADKILQAIADVLQRAPVPAVIAAAA